MRHDTLSPYSEVESFITLARSALEPAQFVERARRYKLTYEQQEVVDKVRLKVWNESTKGEQGWMN